MEPINSHPRRRENSKSLHCNSSEARDRGYKVRLIAVSQFFDKIQIFFCSVLGRLGKLMKRNVGKFGIRGRLAKSGAYNRLLANEMPVGDYGLMFIGKDGKQTRQKIAEIL